LFQGESFHFKLGRKERDESKHMVQTGEHPGFLLTLGIPNWNRIDWRRGGGGEVVIVDC
jgi:hypothetical protein